jgi:magnesium chelatase subunit D
VWSGPSLSCGATVPPHLELPTHSGVLSALLLAVDAPGLGGAVLDHPLHEQARQFALLIQAWLPAGAPLRRVPAGVTADRLYGGVDLSATLASGKLVAERGVLAAADGGVVVFPMAERIGIAPRTALSEALDHGAVQLARDGIASVHAARLCALLLDESVDDELVHPALVDRLAFRLRLDDRTAAELDAIAEFEVRNRYGLLVSDARTRLPQVCIDDRWVSALCETAEAFGVVSVRAMLFAVRTARALAALDGRLAVSEADAERAAALVLAPRATRLPMAPAEPEPPPADDTSDAPPPPSSSEHKESPPPPPERDGDEESLTDDDETTAPPEGGELLREAVTAALPPGLLAQLLDRGGAGAISGRVGEETPNLLRGRPRGARSGLPRGGARLHLLETLRAAAPWQRVRTNALSPAGKSAATTAPRTLRQRVAIRREDFRIRRFVEKTGTTVLFVVDASGSSALYRLAEAKGAVELLLAETYARRDRVSLLAFRGQGTEVLLPPTRALARAKKVLAALPGGGGTPLAHAIEAAMTQAVAIRRGGSAPLVVMLTDGRANIARDGTPGRPGAERDALLAGARFAALQLPALFVDTSAKGEAVARRIADAMRARYVLLPAADARALNGLVRTAVAMAEGSS